MDIEKNSPRTAAIITDSRISLDSIKIVNNHSYLMEEITKRLSRLGRCNWAVAYTWVKAHAGTLGNELAVNWPKRRRGE
jgi:ribonuclease HI